jgi:L-ascorbate metabolism protein UlaG (beta-lactamase superfamily)
LRRAWVQLTRDEAATALPPVAPVDLAELERRSFAVAWLGHSTQLVRVGGQWVMIDPALAKYVGPLDGFGPKRLTPLPLAIEALPRVDVVLISHDHFDHLDLRSVRLLARQHGGPPRFLVGRGLGAWFADHVGLEAEEFDWWQSRALGEVAFTFLPAQHSSGRSLSGRNRTLWGGWLIAHRDRRFYYAGDTAFVERLFLDIRERAGPVDLAALPIGAYQPRKWMRREHVDPAEAVRAQQLLGAAKAFGVHWATFQLGDEEPIQPAKDLVANLGSGGPDFRILPIGGVVDVAP